MQKKLDPEDPNDLEGKDAEDLHAKISNNKFEHIFLKKYYCFYKKILLL